MNMHVVTLAAVFLVGYVVGFKFPQWGAKIGL